ncbi:MAG: PP2C family protein-serine/threonine phosphatase [Bacteroidota bacterium]|nr:PP2C family protein-serine/threonine phosphatase [Bacteroidota bacterium]
MDLLERFDKYLDLPREEAYNQYLDERNFKVFKIILLILSSVFVVIFIVNLAGNVSFNVSSILTLFTLIILAASRIFYNKLFNILNVRKYIFIFLIFQLFMSLAISITYPRGADNDVAAGKITKENVKKDSVAQGDIRISMGDEDDNSYLQYILFFGIMLMIFRFSRNEIIQLFAIGVGVPIIAMLLFNQKFHPGNSIPNFVIGLMFFVVAYLAERKRQKQFFSQYDFNYRKNYDSLRMKKELNYAREIQLSMLPESNATIGEIQISAASLPASEVGGDYFDYFKISENEIGFFICDVSGHGVASGLLLSGLRSCMHLVLEDHSNPKEVIEKLNRMIRKTQSRKMFVTAIFAIVDTEKNKCMLFNAGHLPPYKISGESKEIFKIKKHGVALGAMNNVEREGDANEVMFDFRKGDKLILYTDGVNEAMDQNKSEYGLDNLELYLNNNVDKKTNDLLNGLIQDIRRFTNNSVQRDDLTLLIIQRN